VSDSVHHLERARAARELERRKAALAASLRDLQDGIKETLSPSSVVRAHLGRFLAGAFAMGVGLAIGRRSDHGDD
jgi:hypothetical protein